MRRLLLLFLIILLFCIVSCGDSRVEDVFYQQAEGVSGELELIERGTGTLEGLTWQSNFLMYFQH